MRRAVPTGAAGRALWRRLVADVADDRQLDARDLALLEAAARAADRGAELDAIVERDGMMAAGSKGRPVVHPAVSEARMQRQLVAALLKQVELSSPGEKTGRLSARQRNARREQLADARRARWPRGGRRAAGGGSGPARALRPRVEPPVENDIETPT